MFNKQDIKIQCARIAIDILTIDQFAQSPTVVDIIGDAKKLYDWVQE